MEKVKASVFRPSAELRGRVDEFSKRTGMPVAELLRRAVNEYLIAREEDLYASDARGKKRRGADGRQAEG